MPPADVFLLGTSVPKLLWTSPPDQMPTVRQSCGSVCAEANLAPAEMQSPSQTGSDFLLEPDSDFVMPVHHVTSFTRFLNFIIPCAVL